MRSFILFNLLNYIIMKRKRIDGGIIVMALVVIVDITILILDSIL